MQNIIKNKLLVVTYLLTVLYALHYGIPLYATSSFLHQYFEQGIVSALYMMGSLGALIMSIRIAQFIRKIHTYKFTSLIIISEIISTIIFALSDNIYVVSIFFTIHLILQMILYVCINIFIESFSKQADTGSIRGLFLVLLSLGIIISPFIGGLIITKSSFQMMYIISSVMLIPMFFLLKKYFYHIKEPAYHKVDMISAFKSAWKNKDLRAAVVASLLVESFYSLMIIYSPIYLSGLGVPLHVYLLYILPIALTPLVLFPYEIGILADKKIGEKELMIIGMLILSLSLFLMVTIETNSVTMWTLVLFLSRVGASFVETMAFTYYFKKINKEEASLTALFINTKSLSFILVGFTGIILAPFISAYPALLFIILGVIILYGISYIIPMKDTL